MSSGGSFVVYTSTPERRWCPAAGLLAGRLPLCVTDERGQGLQRLLRAMESPVWIEGCDVHVRRVLVAVDPSAPAHEMQRLLEAGSLLTAATRGELFAVYAWDARGEHLLLQHGSPEYVHQYVESEREHAAALFDAQLYLSPSHLDAAHRLVARGPVTQVIARAVRERNIDALVVGMSHRNRVARVVYGCTAARLADSLPCHVLAVPSGRNIDRRSPPRAVALRKVA